ncbi:phosphatase 2C-like domain-containing protein [Paraphysoderma sedebokerense]|nr:phosphatase 2C-like domain-containing protein [Paraphysoderma sedebokerense]
MVQTPEHESNAPKDRASNKRTKTEQEVAERTHKRQRTRYGLLQGAWCAPKKAKGEDELNEESSIVILKDCGEDAFFVTRLQDVTFAGVTDGVGAWRKRGIDPRWFSWGLSNYYYAIASPDKSPRDIMQEGYERLIESKALKGGSSTAVIIKFDYNTAKLSTAVLGDSRYMIIRNDQILFKSQDMQHYFNAPYQMHINEEKSDTPEIHAITNEHDLKVGDIVIVASDGLFDNSYDANILQTLRDTPYINYDSFSKIIKPKNMKDKNMERVAELLGRQARRFMGDQSRTSPFAKSVNKLMKTDYAGGKLDDVTILAFMVTGPDNSII